MMGRQKGRQGRLFYNFSLEDRVRPNHPLRKIAAYIDFDFVYDEVKDKYGSKGNVSVPPPVILKLMMLLIFYNVRSEREMMDTLPERLDWLWFLGYDLDSDIPNHSVLSKARRRWGVDAFRSFFDLVVWQCVEAKLVDGKKIFLDSSLVDADASNNSVVDTKNLKHQLKKNYKQLEARLEEKESGPYSKVNKRYISSTDPDAAITQRGKSKLRYHVHRAVESKNEIITATKATPGNVDEAQVMSHLVDQHEERVGEETEIVVADSKYGTIENFLACHDRGIHAHVPDLGKTCKKRKKVKTFGEEHFEYDSEIDVYVCPAGNTMKRSGSNRKRQYIYYGCSQKICAACELRVQCTKNKRGRIINRHFRQDELDKMRAASQTPKSKQDIKTRQHFMERSFARAERLGFKRARWRGLWKMEIQEYLTSTIQNIQILITRCDPLKQAAINAINGQARNIAPLKENLNMLSQNQLSKHIRVCFSAKKKYRRTSYCCS